MPADSPCMRTIAKGDSGATNHCLWPQDQHSLTNKQPNTSTQITLPNNKAAPSTIQGALSISPVLSLKAKQVLVLLKLKSSSLISFDQLCNDDRIISLDKKDIKLCKDEKLIIRGYRNPSDGLWDMPIKSTMQLDNVIHPKPKGNAHSIKSETNKHHCLPTFMLNLNPIASTNIRNNHSKKRDNSINSFLSALNPIVDDNHFEGVLNKSNRENHKANVML